MHMDTIKERFSYQEESTRMHVLCFYNYNKLYEF